MGDADFIREVENLYKCISEAKTNNIFALAKIVGLEIKEPEWYTKIENELKAHIESLVARHSIQSYSVEDIFNEVIGSMVISKQIIKSPPLKYAKKQAQNLVSKIQFEERRNYFIKIIPRDFRDQVVANFDSIIPDFKKKYPRSYELILFQLNYEQIATLSNLPHDLARQAYERVRDEFHQFARSYVLKH